MLPTTALPLVLLPLGPRCGPPIWHPAGGRLGPKRLCKPNGSVQTQPAVQCNALAHLRRQASAEEQTKTAAAMRAGHRRIELDKGLEDPLPSCDGDAVSAVDDLKAQSVLREPCHRNMDPARIGEFDGIVSHIEQDLP